MVIKAGRAGNVGGLGLDAIGIEADDVFVSVVPEAIDGIEEEDGAEDDDAGADTPDTAQDG